jgi:hypothetical protein
MKATALQLREIIDNARPRLMHLSIDQVSAKPYDEKWSVKEILGHLLDSASNNHQRIVRMQEVPDIGKFVYSQTHWVISQHYRSEPWDDLVNAWYFANRHLAFVIEHVNPTSLTNVCDMGYPKPATLQFVAEDYVRHVQHHIDQIFSNADPRERSKWKERQ